MRRMRRTLALLLLALAVVACKSNKMTGRRQLTLYGEKSMNDLGAKTYLAMTSSDKVRVSTDARLTAPLQRVGQDISAAANKPEWQWEFKLIDDQKMVNAWALPGGKIAFYTGIYPILKDEAGMAIVMGHEVMHAILQHGNERMSQGAVAQAGLAIGSIALGSSRYRNEIIGALGVGASVGVILPFSRKHESEADQYGLYLAAQAGYDPRAGIEVWERMAALSEGKRPPEFLSTHPDPRNRIKQMKQWMPKALEYYERSQKRQNRPLPAVR